MNCKENKLLILFARKTVIENEISKMKDLMAKELDWSIWLEQVLKHRLAPLCHYQINSMEDSIAERIPEDIRCRLKKEYQVTRSSNIIHYKQLKQIIDTLNSEEVPVLVLKGPVLAATVYKDLGLRRFRDLDLLVIEDHLDKAIFLMKEIGYQYNSFVDGKTNHRIDMPVAYQKHQLNRKIHYEPLWKNLKKKKDLKRSIVEIHHRAVYPDAPFSLDVPELFEEAKNIRLDFDLEALTLAHIDHLIFLCIHLHRHATAIGPIRSVYDLRVLWFLDIYEMINAYGNKILNEVLIKKIEMNQLKEPVYYALNYTNEIYKHPLLSRFLERLRIPYSEYLHTFFPNNDYGPTRYRWHSSFFRRLFSASNAIEAEAILKQEQPKAGWVKCKKIAPSNVDECGFVIDWSSFENHTINEDKVSDWQPYGTHVHSGQRPQNENDLSAKFQICWNENGLIVKIKVKDNNIIFCADIREGVPARFLYDQDAIAIYLGIGNELKRVFLLLRPDIPGGAQCIQQDLQGQKLANDIIIGSDASAKIEESGYTIEAFIPQSFLDITLEPNQRIGFDILILDCEEPEEGIAKSLVWAGGKSQYGGLSMKAGRYESGEILLIDDNSPINRSLP